MFPFVHPAIAALLTCNEASRKGPYLDTKNLQINGWEQNSKEAPSLEAALFLADDRKEALTLLAHECDDFVFQQNGLKSPDEGFQTMVAWGCGKMKDENLHSSAQSLLASLLATNRLEAAIRLATNHTSTGRAPLLKNMIEKLGEQDTANNSLVSVLRALLLPNPGLNLRNLLWHGFVADMPRPWLALVLVLVFILERDHSTTTKDCSTQVDVPQICSYPEFEPILQRGKELRETNLQAIDTSWVEEINSASPKLKLKGSYQDWWKLIQHWIATKESYPISICILLTCLLEHGLRQLWCHANHRPEDRIARPGVFYVTLDGHGQRYKHEVLLHPYVGDETAANGTKNALIDQLGGPIVALLADMYSSPCGGPNLRASLAHGLWDSLLQQEVSKTSNGHQKEDSELLWDLVDVMLVLMEAIGDKVGASKPNTPYIPLKDYRPMFSYTSATRRNLRLALDEIKQVVTSLQGNDKLASAVASTNLRLDGIQNLRIVSLQRLDDQAMSLLQHCACERVSWRTQDIFLEHETNKVFASLGAARTLLEEVAEACAAYRVAINNSNEEEELSSRKRKHYLRILAASELITAVYPFASLTALLLLEFDLKASVGSEGSSIDRASLLQAVKRSRMMVSTVSNFITANTDRAIKAAKEYSRAKVVKAIVQCYKQQQEQETTSISKS